MLRTTLLITAFTLSASGDVSGGAISGDWECSGSARAVSLSQQIDSFSFSETVYLTDDSVDWFCDETIALEGNPDTPHGRHLRSQRHWSAVERRQGSGCTDPPRLGQETPQSI